MSTTSVSSLSNDVPLIRPKPRRPFDFGSTTPESSNSHTGANTPLPESSPSLNQLDSFRLYSTAGIATPSGIPKRTRSTIALTASTLFGIYSNHDESEPSTPYTISRNSSMLNVYESDYTNGTTYLAPPPPKQTPRRHRIRRRPTFLTVMVRLLALLGFGVTYGIVVSHLHNTKTFTPSWWEEIESFSPSFLLGWGLAGVFLGSLLPWIDFMWDGDNRDEREKEPAEASVFRVVRNIGSFFGIAFAIRKIPWQSTLQLALTIAMANPWLWYLIDRTRAGFCLSVFVGITGTLILFQLNPNLIRAPETSDKGMNDALFAGLVSEEKIGIWVWISSVLFCSSVCFGNIGRLLAFREKEL